MKIKIKPYLYTLIKENILYIAAGILMILLIIILIGLNLEKIPENEKKIDSLTNEVKVLKTRASVLSAVAPQAAELDSDIRFLNILIPNSEDYFSILYTLEQLSAKTNFIITSYTINIKSSTANKLRLTISGVGDNNTFINFLRQYNFAGGRLVTSDKIELSPQLTGNIKIDITFYNKKTVIDKNFTLLSAPKSLAEVAALKNKVQFSLKEASDEGNLDYSYPKKPNLF